MGVRGMIPRSLQHKHCPHIVLGRCTGYGRIFVARDVGVLTKRLAYRNLNKESLSACWIFVLLVELLKVTVTCWHPIVDYTLDVTQA